MEERGILIPKQVRDAARTLLLFDQLSKATKDELTTLLEERVLARSKNPWVWVQQDDTDTYLCRLSDYLLVMLTFRSENVVARWAMADEVEMYPRDTGLWNFFHGDHGLHLVEGALPRLQAAFDEWAIRYHDPEISLSFLPLLAEFTPIYEAVMCDIPRRGVVAVRREGIPYTIEIEDDMRKAALMIVSGATIGPVNFSHPTKIDVYFEDSNHGTFPLQGGEWEPDARQWAQMQGECAPRCEWEDMLAAANRVVTQKRFKKSVGELE